MNPSLHPVWQFSLHYGHAAIWVGSLLMAIFIGVRVGSMRQLASTTLVLTFCLVVLGAFVRLSDAGLGCPDWPGCYGQLSPLHAQTEIEEAQQSAPHGPVSIPKAWKEMLHRYLASLVGALIVAILIKSLGQRAQRSWHPAAPRIKITMPLLLLIVVCMQGLFGKWTVTLLLKPAIVTGHLMGGMILLGLLTWFYQQQRDHALGHNLAALQALRPLAILALLVLFGQILLGGWVSTNYAAAVCGKMPDCQGQWLPQTDFGHGYQILRELGKTAAGQHLSLPALTAIHLTHRYAAGLVLLVLAVLAWRTTRLTALRGVGLGLGLALVIQISLGLSVVSSMAHGQLAWQLPLAALHNAGAALLLVLLVTLNYKCHAASQE